MVDPETRCSCDHPKERHDNTYPHSCLVSSCGCNMFTIIEPSSPLTKELTDTQRLVGQVFRAAMSFLVDVPDGESDAAKYPEVVRDHVNRIRSQMWEFVHHVTAPQIATTIQKFVQDPTGWTAESCGGKLWLNGPGGWKFEFIYPKPRFEVDGDRGSDDEGWVAIHLAHGPDNRSWTREQIRSSLGDDVGVRDHQLASLVQASDFDYPKQSTPEV